MSLIDLGGDQKPKTAAETFEQIRKLLGANSAPPKQPPTLPADALGRFFRQLLAHSFAQDARGERLRAAWRLVGDGLKTILEEAVKPPQDASP